MNQKYDILKLENQLCFPLYAASRKVVSAYTPYLKELGITYTQYIVMMVLWEEDDVTVGEIGRRLHLDNGTISPLLRKLEKKDLVRRQRNEGDERVVNIQLTEQGREMRDRALEIPQAVSDCLGLKERDAAALYELLYRIIDSEE